MEPDSGVQEDHFPFEVTPCQNPCQLGENRLFFFLVGVLRFVKGVKPSAGEAVEGCANPTDYCLQCPGRGNWGIRGDVAIGQELKNLSTGGSSLADLGER